MSPRHAENLSSNNISRRAFIRGAGVAMALPWLESMPVWGTAPLAGGVPGPFPKRFATLFTACGINSHHWWARGSGAEMELGKSLEPMAPIKTKMNFVTGLFNRSAVGVGIHPGQTGNILSGAVLKKGAELKGGISMDQVLANHIGQETVQPSMVLGCEQPITGYHETNFSSAYSSYISWQSATSPVPMEVYPSLAFDSAEAKGDPFNPDVSPVRLDMHMELPANDWRPGIRVSWYQGGAMPESPSRMIDLNRIDPGAMYEGDKGILVADFRTRLLYPLGSDATLTHPTK